MEYLIVDDKNVKTAIEIQEKIFPLESAEDALRRAATNNIYSYLKSLKYWLVKKNGKYVGICGLYAYKSDPKDAWLGWFGVLESERKKGYGTQILSHIMQLAKELGYENFRLYTDEISNAKAVKLYESFGMIREIYNNSEDSHFQIGNTLIFSKNLLNKPTSLWNNKNLFLGGFE